VTNRNCHVLLARFVFILWISLATTACLSVPGTRPSVSIRPIQEPIILHRSRHGVHIEMDVMLRNKGSAAIYLLDCSPELQRNLNDQWVTVWSPPCINFGPPQEILPGNSSVVPVKISAFSDRSSQPQLDPRLQAGKYRLLWHITSSENGTGSANQRSSAPSYSEQFAVIEAENRPIF
jgi:hypothetical protein